MSPVFRHGLLRLYLLKLLDEEPRHGYDVIRLLQDRFLGVYSPSPGTIYPRLARLEEEGLVTHDVVDGKKVYQITDAGREEVHSRLDDLAEHHKERLAETAEIVRGGGPAGLTSWQIATGVTWSRAWSELVSFQRQAAVGEVLSHLRHLQARGLAAEMDQDGVGRWRLTTG